LAGVKPARPWWGREHVKQGCGEFVDQSELGVSWPLTGREPVLSHVAELFDGNIGVAILGPAGVGKSRLLHEIVDRVHSRGVIKAVASRSTRVIPFAPFVELLPDGPTSDRLSMLQAARAGVEARGGSTASLLIVDDAHHLDEMSLAFLTSMVASGDAIVAVTVTTGEPMEADLVDLWTNGAIERIDLGPLDRNQSDRLIESTLGDVAPELQDELWRLAQGHPLVLHELVEGAVGNSLEQDEEGTWVAVGPLTDSTRLADLVTSRLRALPDELQDAMSLIAVGTPLPLDLAREAIGDHLGELEQRRLVETTGSVDEKVVIPAHPIYGEILKAHLGDTRRIRAYRRLVEAAGQMDHLADPLRGAIWQRDGGELILPELAIAGAQEALVRHDPALAEQLLAPLDSADERVALLRGRALSYQQRFEEAESILAGPDPVDQELLSEKVSIRAQNLGFGLGRVSEARALLESAAVRVEDPWLKARLTNERAMISAIHGDFVDAQIASDAVLSDPETPVPARAAAYVTLTIALAMTGDCDQLDAIVDEALDTGQAAEETLPFARDQIEIMQVSSLLNAGRIDDAIDLFQAAVSRRDRGNAMTSTWFAAAALAHELAGLLAQGISYAREALTLFKGADPFGLEAQARGVLAALLGQSGDARAGEVLDAALTSGPGARLAVWVSRGRTWVEVARGRVRDGALIAAEGGRLGMEGEHYAWAALCFTDAVRLGYPELVVDELRDIDASRGAHLIAALQGFAEASVAEDPGSLESTAGRFLDFGTLLLAAEAFARAGVLYARNGEVADGARCVVLSMAAERRCGNPETPELAARPTLVTPREFDVALDAASGLTSPKISEKRFISVRTVDNHLGSLYRKLRVGGRDEVAQILQPVTARG
jgi:DNA-binding CsgD family transcriptional regulator/tetratricopeptide (TPR) repeat protein